MALFESYERRIDKINSVLNSYGISSIEEAEKITKDAGLNVYDQIKGIQPICFENACWAYTVGAAIAIKKNCRRVSGCGFAYAKRRCRHGRADRSYIRTADTGPAGDADAGYGRAAGCDGNADAGRDGDAAGFGGPFSESG